MKKKMMAAVVCFSMLAGTFAGCGATEEASKKTDKTEEAAENTEDGGTDTLSIFVNFPWYPVDSFTGKIPEKVKEITGVDLDVTIATDANQLGVMIASGELPDLVFTDDTGGVLSSLSNSDVCYSLEELAKETGVSFEETESYEERSKIASSFSADGQAYTLLNNYSSKEAWDNLKMGTPGMPCIYYRKDLLDAAGIKVPTNLDEFTECLGQVKEAYPDMTPYGLGGVHKLLVISNWMGVSAEQYNPETGEYLHSTSTPSYKKFLKYCNDMYRAGYITAQDYAVENEADSHQMAYNDGCVFYSWYALSTNLSQLQSNAVSETAEWAVLRPLGAAPAGTNKGWAGAFISKNCSNPEAAAKLVSYLNTEEGCRLSLWGVEGEDYTMDEDGVPTFSEEYLAARNDANKYYTEYNALFYFGASAVREIYQSFAGLDEETLEDFTAYAEGYKNYPEVGIATPISTSDEGVIKSKLDELVKSYEAKVIFTDTDEDFEAAYEEFMEAMKQTGVEKYNTYMTERIAEVKSEFGF